MRILILADDFTGALDTGVQFSSKGFRTKVVVDLDAAFDETEADVLVIDTETRHIAPSAAYEAIAALVRRAKEARVPYIYKKTDSALRGNVGAELRAVLEASGAGRLPFFPAYPKTGRTTVRGIHYIDGVPVAESGFGRDPFEPVTESEVVKILRAGDGPAAAKIDEETRGTVRCASLPPLRNVRELEGQEGILVFDAETDDDLERAAETLGEATDCAIFAGCAGFADVLAKRLQCAGHALPPAPRTLSPKPAFLVLCGSVNPVTRAQLKRAEEAGFTRIRIPPEESLAAGFWESERGRARMDSLRRTIEETRRIILDTNDPEGREETVPLAKARGLDKEGMRLRITSFLAEIGAQVFTSGYAGRVLLTGGDTLLATMKRLGVRELAPRFEYEKGVVAATFVHAGREHEVVTKSGGFGTEDLLLNLGGMQ